MTDTPPPLPPQLPPDAVPVQKKGLSTLAIILIVVGAIGLVVIAGVIGTVAVVVPQMHERQQRLTCQQNLNMLGSLFAMRSMERPGKPKYDGAALFLSWRKTRDLIQGGKEDVLLCPGDTSVRPLLTDADRQRYDTIDLANPPRDACSYAVRDFGRFPLPKVQEQPEILAACTHHAKGVNVVFIDGQVKFYEWRELGLTGPEEADVGPDAKSPILRQVCRTPGVTEK